MDQVPLGLDPESADLDPVNSLDSGGEAVFPCDVVHSRCRQDFHLVPGRHLFGDAAAMELAAADDRLGIAVDDEGDLHGPGFSSGGAGERSASACSRRATRAFNRPFSTTVSSRIRIRFRFNRSWRQALTSTCSTIQRRGG